jgi:hypothetical protein
LSSTSSRSAISDEMPGLLEQPVAGVAIVEP